MTQIRIAADSIVDAPADRVYGYLADYERHHPKILPPAFTDFAVEEGGVGEGTIIRFTMTAGGRTRTARQRVTEPLPGRIIQESDIDDTAVTTFTVTPDGERSHVHIETTYEGSRGLMGMMERAIAPRILGKVFDDELGRLNRYAQEEHA
jgi:uncharacterized membrane protein